MLYLLAAMTFLSSLLIYSLYPRTDNVKRVDLPVAKLAATELVMRHNAALQAATLLRTDSNGKKYMKYEDWTSNGKAPYTITTQDIKTFLPKNANIDYKSQSLSMPIASLILCIDNATAAPASNCAQRKANTKAEAASFGTTDFLITYTSLSATAGHYGTYYALLTPRALGQMTHFTEYDPERHLSTNCGIIQKGRLAGKDFDPNNAEYLLSNTRHQTVNLPIAFTNMLSTITDTNKEKVLDHYYIACITRLSVAYDSGENKIVLPKKKE